jgi:hypothetical protein
MVIDPECDTCTKPSASPQVPHTHLIVLMEHPGARHREIIAGGDR